jgi:alpha-D-ribose 1-methylphosphonate 5-triphosphate synthase subunit PhnG
MSIEIRNLPYFDLSTVFQYSTDQSDENQTPQIAIDYQGDTFRTGLPISSGGGASSNFETISQPGHTFVIGDAVLKQTDGTYLLAEGHTETDPAVAATHDNTGIVSAIGAGANADKVTVTFNGKIPIGGVSGGRYETALQTGSIYYLASGTPGLCQPAYPASRTTYRPAFVALNGTDAYVIDDRSGIPTGRFTNLMDVPASYVGQSTKLVRVNVGATGLEFFASPTGFGGAFVNLSDVPASYVGKSLNLVRVNLGETGLEFTSPGMTFLAQPLIVLKVEQSEVAGHGWYQGQNDASITTTSSRTSAVSGTWYTFTLTGHGVPSTATMLIIEASANSQWADNATTYPYFVWARQVLASTNTYALLRQAIGYGGNAGMVSHIQGIYPLAAGGSFIWSTNRSSVPGYGILIRIVGYA